MDKISRNRYFSNLYFFASISIFTIFFIEYIEFLVDTLLGEKKLEIFNFFILNISVFLAYFSLVFFRKKTKVPTKKVRSYLFVILALAIINFLFISENYNLIIQILIIDLGCIYIIFQICKTFDQNPSNWLGLIRFDIKKSKYFLYYFWAWPLIIFWALIVEYLNIEALKNSSYTQDIVEALNNNYIIIFFLACIVAPLSEEIIFRGFIFKIIRQKYSTSIAIIINSFLFGIIHLSPSAIIPASILGAALSIIRIKTNSVYGSIIIHSLHNLFALIITTQAL